jgi:hypothetical protein
MPNWSSSGLRAHQGIDIGRLLHINPLLSHRHRGNSLLSDQRGRLLHQYRSKKDYVCSAVADVEQLDAVSEDRGMSSQVGRRFFEMVSSDEEYNLPKGNLGSD